MSYAVYLKRSAEKELAGLPGEVHQKIIKRLLTLKDNPRPPGARNCGEVRDTASEWVIIGCSIRLTMTSRK